MDGNDLWSDKLQHNSHQPERLGTLSDVLEKKEEISASYKQMTSILCKIHGRKHLEIDKHAFCFVCWQCKKEKINTTQLIFSDDTSMLSEVQQKFLAWQLNDDSEKANHSITTREVEQNKLIAETQKEDWEEDYSECNNHMNKKGCFYCDNCKYFICKFCFANEHREHTGHLPSVIAKEFKNQINKSIIEVSKLRPILDDSFEEVTQIWTRLKIQKQNTVKQPETTLSSIIKNNNTQLSQINESFLQKLNNLDKEASDNYLRFTTIKDKTLKYLQEWDDQYKALFKTSPNVTFSKKEICKFHRTHKNYFNTVSNFYSTSLNFLITNLKNSWKKHIWTKPSTELNIQWLKKHLRNYEVTSVASISTGQASNSILLRRFMRFIHNEVKYFKSTSLTLRASQSVFLTGISLCGLYIHKKKMTDPTTNFSNSDSIKITITLSEVEEGKAGKPKLVENGTIYSITDKNDPTYIVYFSKGIKINKDKEYLIMIDNVDDNNYCDFWVGSSGKEAGDGNGNMNSKIKSGIFRQCIKEHNTGTIFGFNQMKEIQTDFDEFTMGIIEGILYSKN